MMKLKQKISTPLGFSILFNAVVLFVSIFVFHPFFEENDDAFLALLSEGAYGAHESHLIYVSTILGKIMTILSSILPMIRWHSIMQYLFLFLSFCMITYLLCERKQGKLYAVLFILSTFYELYVSLQYTKTAAFTVITGFVCLFTAAKSELEKGRRHTVILVVGDVLIIYGALLRNSSFYLACIPALCMGLYEIYRYLVLKKEAVKKVLELFGKIFLPVVCFVFLLFVVDSHIYANDAQWSAFKKYNNTRMKLLDYRYDLLDYQKYSESLQGLGVSSNDALLYLTWQFGDDRICTADFMNAVLESGASKEVNIELLKAFVSNLFEQIYSLNALLPGMLCLLVFLLRCMSQKEKRRYAVFLCLEGIITFVILSYFQYSGRWNHRVVYALLTVMLLLAVFIGFFNQADSNESERPVAFRDVFAVSAVLLLFLNGGLFLGNQFNYQAYLRTEPDSHAQTSYMQTRKDTLFVLDTFTFQHAYQYDVFHAYEEGSLDNVIAVGSWFVNSPVTKSIAERYGCTNPFDALENEQHSTILVDNYYPREKALYLREHYGKIIEPVHEETRNGYDFYSMKETQNEWNK